MQEAERSAVLLRRVVIVVLYIQSAVTKYPTERLNQGAWAGSGRAMVQQDEVVRHKPGQRLALSLGMALSLGDQLGVHTKGQLGVHGGVP